MRTKMTVAERIARDLDVYELRTKGCTLESIGELYGLTRARIQQLIRDSGRRDEIEAACAAAKPEPQRSVQERQRDERRYKRAVRNERAVELYRAGKTQTEIGNMIGLSQARVSAMLIHYLSDGEREALAMRNWLAGVNGRTENQAKGQTCERCGKPSTTKHGICGRPACKPAQMKRIRG